MITFQSIKRARLLLVILISCASSYLDAAPIIVNSAGDESAVNANTSPTTAGGTITLRSALEYSNANAPTPQVIHFSNGFVIQPGNTTGNELPAISTQVTIDGYAGSPGGATPNTDPLASNAILTVVINGSNYTVGDGVSFGEGLLFVPGSAGSVVKGLVINEWIYSGITLFEGNISVVGNFIGTDITGTTQMANKAGVLCYNVNEIIGTSAPNFDVADRNIIAGSFMCFVGSTACITIRAPGTSVKGNLIGLDKTGTRIIGNSQIGISLINVANNIIGGATAAERNIISGHSIWGIALAGASNNSIQGNYLGTNAAGTDSLSNRTGKGIFLISSSSSSPTNNHIVDNVISGWDAGIKLGLLNARPGSNNNFIQGNFIGTDWTSTKALPNTYGILINDNFNFIGLDPVAPLASQGNVISGNINTGITIYGGANNTQIQGNHIGVDISNTKPLGNGSAGVQLGLAGGAAFDNLIGGSSSIDGNFIGANGKYGILVKSYSSGNDIRNNIFGIGALANGEENIQFLCSQGNIAISN